MDAISYSYADKQSQRIKKFNENPDSTSGILTQPSVIQAGETVNIPAGRTAIMANTQIDGTITLGGTMFIPSGATTNDIDAQLALKAPLENPAFTSAISTRDVNYKSTLVSVTSWSYVTTTITLNVASHTFVSGDYIEVSGLTSSTYPANGIHLVTSVTSTTIVFTLSAIPTGTAGVTSATVKGTATLNGKVINTSKITQNVSANRAISTTYYNTSGKQKHVSIIVTGAGNTSTGIQILKNGEGVSYSYVPAISSASIAINPQADIENGDSYSVINTGGAIVSLVWYETI